MANSQSTQTLQQMYDKVVTFGDMKLILGDVAAYQLEPFITICTDVYSDIVGVAFPHKWNEIKLPIFYSNSLQQDYALINPNGTSVFNIEWLQNGIVVEQSSQGAEPKPWSPVECGRSQAQQLGSWTSAAGWNWQWPMFTANLIFNYMAYYGTWGGTNTDKTFGNNPGPGAVYTDPTANTTGQQANPITQIIDPNGNLQVVVTYGTCGSSAPVWPPANAAAGTLTQDGTTQWRVVDPNGYAIRITPVPCQTGVVFQFNLIGQMPAIQFTSLRQTFAPFPDKYLSYFRQGIIAQGYRWSSDPKIQAKFEKNYQIWLKSLNDLRSMQDRELEEYQFAADRSVFSAGAPARTGWVGAANPFNYPLLGGR